MEFYLKNKIVILRTVGSLMLVIGFAAHFWVTPKKVFSQNDRAAANIARMEAKVKPKGSDSKASSPAKKDHSKYLDKLKNAQEKQMQYLTIIAMIFGFGFLGYSFIKKKEDVELDEVL